MGVVQCSGIEVLSNLHLPRYEYVLCKIAPNRISQMTDEFPSLGSLLNYFFEKYYLENKLVCLYQGERVHCFTIISVCRDIVLIMLFILVINYRGGGVLQNCRGTSVLLLQKGAPTKKKEGGGGSRGVSHFGWGGGSRKVLQYM